MAQPRKPKLFLLFLLLALPLLSACATSHVLRWSRGRDSMFEQPTKDSAPFVHPASVVLSLPIAFAWDVGTFPFQWLWGVHPYGATMTPASAEQKEVGGADQR